MTTRRFLKELFCIHKWVRKHTTELFFLGKLRKKVTFYKECSSCKKISIIEK